MTKSVENALMELEKANEKEDLISIIKEMVAIPTESPVGEGYQKFIDYVNKLIKERLPGFQTEQIVVPMEFYKEVPGFREKYVQAHPRIILRVKSPYAEKNKLHIHGHYDVVAGGDPTKWTMTKPFDPVVKGDRLYGRGSADMKSTIACIIKAFEIISRNQLKPNFSINLTLTPDEEVPTFPSPFRYMIDQTLQGERYFDADTVLVLDGSFESIIIGTSGFISYRIICRGKDAHSSRSFLGVNAIFMMIPVLTALHDLSLKIASRWSKYPVTSDLPILKLKPCLNATLINGGTVINAIPDICTVEGDRRVAPDEDMNEAVLELQNTILDVKLRNYLNLEFEVTSRNPPFGSRLDNNYLQAYMESAKHVLQKELPAVGELGSADVAYVKTLLGKDVIAHGLEDAQCNMHGIDESVSIPTAVNMTKILIKFLAK